MIDKVQLVITLNNGEKLLIPASSVAVDYSPQYGSYELRVEARLDQQDLVTAPRVLNTYPMGAEPPGLVGPADMKRSTEPEPPPPQPANRFELIEAPEEKK